MSPVSRIIKFSKIVQIVKYWIRNKSEWQSDVETSWIVYTRRKRQSHKKYDNSLTASPAVTSGFLAFKNLSGSGCNCVEACKEGWEMKGEHCYLWSTDKKSWTAAEDFCLKDRGHLASATSNTTSVFFWEGMKRKGIRNVWIGGNDIEEEGSWKWTDCNPFQTTFWKTGEPNNAHNAEDCVQMVGGRYVGTFNDVSCGTSQQGLCSKKICSGRNPNIR